MRPTPREPAPATDQPPGRRLRLLLVSALVVAGVLLVGSAAEAQHAVPLAPGPSAQVVSTTTTTTEVLAGTTLEADNRNDGTPQTRWLIGSAIVAAAAIALGGTLLKRRMT